MAVSPNHNFDPLVYLAQPGTGRSIVEVKAKGVFFSQGSPADSIFYLQKGRAKVTIVSKAGKEATITLLAAGDWVRSRLPVEPGCVWQPPTLSPRVLRSR